MALAGFPVGNTRKLAWWTSSRLRDASVLLLSTLLLFAIEYHSGAFTVDLASDPDEPAHAVSSLMVRDYLAHGFPQNPVAFAWNFYQHYPKVSIGHWPPLLYCVEAVWMLLVGRSRAALLVFITLCGAALVASMYLEVKRRCSRAAALVSVAVLLSTRIFHQMLYGVHPDIPLALLVFWAAVHCGEYMRFGSRKSRNLFLGFTLAALLVHGRGGVLVFLPFLLLPLRPRLAKWKWLTSAAFLVFLMLAILLTPPLLHQAPFNSLLNVPSRIRDFFLSTAFLTGWPWKSYAIDGVALVAGWPWAVLAACGVPLIFRPGREQQFWAAMGGIVLASMIFYLLVPVPLEYRFLLSSMLAVAVLAGGGVEFLLRGNLPYRPTLRIAFCAAAIAWMLFSAAHVEAKPDRGYRRMVAQCLFCGHDTVLIAADEINEGALIVESSLTDPERSRTVLRASKFLASSGWTGWNRRLLFDSPAQVRSALDQAHVSLVILETDCQLPQVLELRAALDQDPADWRPASLAAQVAGTVVFLRNPPPDSETR